MIECFVFVEYVFVVMVCDVDQYCVVCDIVFGDWQDVCVFEVVDCVQCVVVVLQCIVVLYVFECVVLC